MKKTILALLLVSVLIPAGSGVLCAEPEKQHEKQRERVEAVALYKMLEVLDLDNAATEKVLEVRKKFSSKRKEQEKSLREDFRKLRDLVEKGTAGTDDKDLAALVKSITQRRKQLSDVRDEEFAELSKFLSVRQQAKLIVFLRDFHREMRQMMHAGRPERPGPEHMGQREPGGRMVGPPPPGRGGPPPGGPRGNRPGPPGRSNGPDDPLDLDE